MPLTFEKFTIKRRPKAIVYEQTVNYSDLSPEDQRKFDEALSTPDPYAVLRAKTQHLAELLGCSEGQAEAIILERIGSPDSGFGDL